MASIAGHDTECMCPSCLMADLNAHVMANGGKIYADEKTAPEKTRNLPAGQKVGRGYVRKISDRQVWFIRKMIEEKDTSNLVILPGQTLNDKEIPNMGVKGGSALIEKLMSCPDKPIAKKASYSVKVTDQGSDKQKSYLTSLMQQTNLTESDINATYKTVSDAISDLIIKAKSMPKVAKHSNTKTDEITEGIYKLDNRIFKVYMNRANTCMLVKELIDEEFEYLGSAQYKLPKGAVKMTLEEAKAYGKLTGTCINCGRKLTDEGSIEAGIGPICAARF